jgi:hypothetical protein
VNAVRDSAEEIGSKERLLVICGYWFCAGPCFCLPRRWEAGIKPPPPLDAIGISFRAGSDFETLRF